MSEPETESGGLFGTKRSSIVRQTILACVLAFLINLSLRAIGLSFWLNPNYYALDAPLLPTPDAYGWVAGAQGTGRLSVRGLSHLIALVHDITGANLAVIDFWLPLAIAPLVVIPVAVLCAAWGAPEAAILAGIMAGGVPAFLLRTRVGYGDTDILTLFLPLMFIVLLWWWLRPWFRGRGLPDLWRGLKRLCRRTDGGQESSGRAASEPSIRAAWAFALLPAALLRFHMWWHPESWVLPLCLMVGAAALALLLAEGRWWQHVIGGLGIVLAGGVGGWLGLALCAAAVLLVLISPRTCRRAPVPWVLVVLASGLVGWYAARAGALSYLYKPLLVFLKLVPARGAGAGGLLLPSVTRSVGEAEGMPLSEMLFQVGLHGTVYAAGLAGLAWLIWRRAAALLLVPMLLLSVLALRMGFRFSMYGAPVIGMGIGMGVTFLLRRLDQGLKRRWLVHGVLAVALALSLQQVVRRLGCEPFLSPVYARTLVNAKQDLPRDARLWTWWDFGYAAQYLCGRETFADPQWHGQGRLFALAKVFGTDSARQAAQLMYHTTSAEQPQRSSETVVNPGAEVEYYDVDPLKPLMKLRPAEAKARLERLSRKDVNFSADLPAQYVVAAWGNTKALYWIRYYGTWDLASGEGQKPDIVRLKSAAMVNEQEGYALVGDSKLSLASLDVLTADGVRHREWESEEDRHLVYHAPAGEALIMDGGSYRSMAVQLLVGDPEQFSEHFELVEESYPWVRVYRARK